MWLACNMWRLCNMVTLLRGCNREKPEQRVGIRGMRNRFAYHSCSRLIKFLAVRDFAYNAYPSLFTLIY